MLKLNDPSLLETRAFVNGQWIENGNTFPVHNPSTGEKIADVTDLAISDVSFAIDGAYDAKTAWGMKTGKDRVRTAVQNSSTVAAG